MFRKGIVPGLVVMLLVAFAVIGCQSKAPTSDGQTSDEQSKEYEIKGTVVAIGDDQKSVTLDHEDIPNLMKGMEMKFQVQDPQVVAEIKPGDKVRGHLKVESGDYIITHLEVVSKE